MQRAESQGGMKMPGFVEERTVQGHDIASSSRACGFALSWSWEYALQAEVEPAAVYVTAVLESKTRTRLVLSRLSSALLGGCVLPSILADSTLGFVE